VTLNEESSTKAVPKVRTTTSIVTDMKVAVAKLESKKSTIKQKYSNQKIGQQVEPCPGPNSGKVGVLE
jgi:hypothetical protein